MESRQMALFGMKEHPLSPEKMRVEDFEDRPDVWHSATQHHRDVALTGKSGPPDLPADMSVSERQRSAGLHLGSKEAAQDRAYYLGRYESYYNASEVSGRALERDDPRRTPPRRFAAVIDPSAPAHNTPANPTGDWGSGWGTPGRAEHAGVEETPEQASERAGKVQYYRNTVEGAGGVSVRVPRREMLTTQHDAMTQALAENRHVHPQLLHLAQVGMRHTGNPAEYLGRELDPQRPGTRVEQPDQMSLLPVTRQRYTTQGLLDQTPMTHEQAVEEAHAAKPQAEKMYAAQYNLGAQFKVPSWHEIQAHKQTTGQYPIKNVTWGATSGQEFEEHHQAGLT